MTLNALSEFLEVNKENLTPDPFLTYDMSTPMKEEGDLNLNTTNSKSRTPLGDITPQGFKIYILQIILVF